VVDFTAMTDDEILRWFARQSGPTCGRFNEDQLKRSLVAAPERKVSRWGYWNYVVAGLLLSAEVSAQTAPAGVPAIQQPLAGQEDRNLIGDIVANPIKRSPADTVRGRVTDSSGQGISLASVIIKSGYGIITDKDGYFSFDASPISRTQLLAVYSVGYEKATISVENLRATGKVVMRPIVFDESSVMAGMVSVRVKPRTKVRSLADTLTVIKDTLACVGVVPRTLKVYPNPVARGSSITLSLRLDQPGVYRAELFSISGTLMQTAEISGEQKERSLLMNIPADLAPGVYLVRFSHPAMKKIYTQQIIVQ
jgi:hypothetical protein